MQYFILTSVQYSNLQAIHFAIYIKNNAMQYATIQPVSECIEMCTYVTVRHSFQVILNNNPLCVLWKIIRRIRAVHSCYVFLLLRYIKLKSQLTTVCWRFGLHRTLILKSFVCILVMCLIVCCLSRPPHQNYFIVNNIEMKKSSRKQCYFCCLSALRARAR